MDDKKTQRVYQLESDIRMMLSAQTLQYSSTTIHTNSVHKLPCSNFTCIFNSLNLVYMSPCIFHIHVQCMFTQYYYIKYIRSRYLFPVMSTASISHQEPAVVQSSSILTQEVVKAGTSCIGRTRMLIHCQHTDN